MINSYKISSCLMQTKNKVMHQQESLASLQSLLMIFDSHKSVFFCVRMIHRILNLYPISTKHFELMINS